MYGFNWNDNYCYDSYDCNVSYINNTTFKYRNLFINKNIKNILIIIKRFMKK